jgi:hypothetical protein
MSKNSPVMVPAMWKTHECVLENGQLQGQVTEGYGMGDSNTSCQFLGFLTDSDQNKEQAPLDLYWLLETQSMLTLL